MFEKHKYKILATVLILVILGTGTFYYLKKKREKKEAEEKAALEEEKRKKMEASKNKNLIKDTPAPKTAPKHTPDLSVANTDKPIV